MSRFVSYFFLLCVFLTPLLDFLPLTLTFYPAVFYFLTIIFPLLFLITLLKNNKTQTISYQTLILSFVFFVVQYFVNIMVIQYQDTKGDFFSYTNLLQIQSLLNLGVLFFIFLIGRLVSRNFFLFRRMLFFLSLSSLIVSLVYIFVTTIPNLLFVQEALLLRQRLIIFLFFHLFATFALLLFVWEKISFKNQDYLNETKTKIAAVLIFLVNFFAFLILLYKSFFFPPEYWPLKLSYSLPIAISAFDDHFFLGVGINLFSQAFNLYKPPSINLENYWQYPFTHSGNEILEIATTQGLVGLISFFLLFITGVKLKKEPALSLLIILLLFVSFFSPWSQTLQLCLFFILGVISVKKSDVIKDGKLFSIISKLILCLVGLIILIVGLILLSSDYYYQKSLRTTKPEEKYALEKKSLQIFYFDDRKHRQFSLTSLALADALGRKNRLSPPEQDRIGKLIKQSVSYGKSAVLLNPYDSQNYSSLGRIYKNLLDLSDSSYDLSLSLISQAIKRDPVNPSLQAEIGYLFLVKKNYDQAEKFFNNSLTLKPNYVSALYGLGMAEKAKGNTKKAKDSFEKALKFTPLGSTDFLKIQEELQNL